MRLRITPWSIGWRTDVFGGRKIRLIFMRFLISGWAGQLSIRRATFLLWGRKDGSSFLTHSSNKTPAIQLFFCALYRQGSCFTFLKHLDLRSCQFVLILHPCRKSVFLRHHTLLPRPYLSLPYGHHFSIAKNQEWLVWIHDALLMFSKIKCMIRKRWNVGILVKKFEFYLIISER